MTVQSEGEEGGGATHRLPPSVGEVLPQQQTQLGGDGHVGVRPASSLSALTLRLLQLRLLAAGDSHPK